MHEDGGFCRLIVSNETLTEEPVKVGISQSIKMGLLLQNQILIIINSLLLKFLVGLTPLHYIFLDVRAACSFASLGQRRDIRLSISLHEALVLNQKYTTRVFLMIIIVAIVMNLTFITGLFLQIISSDPK